jgi:hypothetical protein
VLALLLLLLALTVVGMPTWPYSTRWTYYPSGVCGLAALTLAFLVVIGRL